ncbi:AIPR family protein [Lactiplantibacillus modestisalitolerans]|uniref:AIPR family protein n=1 Tax=Lactiplantibacillus modestisalitolerans TaxID=1457219 RepID=A0ABV5WSM2_9LACO|nr:AIPR family protein [Lactiplantibacillus modestisalitolerans]
MNEIEHAIDEMKLLLKDFPADTKPKNDVDWFTLMAYNYVINERGYLKDIDLITEYRNYFVNGSNDGGIDMLYYNDKLSVLGILQTKYSNNIDVNSATAEIQKILRTVEKLQNHDFSNLSQIVKDKFRSLNDGINEDVTYEITLVTTSTFDKERALKNVGSTKRFKNSVDFNIVNGLDLSQKIYTIKNGIQRVDNGKLELINVVNQSGRSMEYSSNSKKGIFVSAKASSIKKLYDLYENRGLFDLNVRKYIKRNSIDKGIINTIQRDPTEFWFLNNGLTIATSDYQIDGNVIHLQDFSVVNGAQTTTLIARNYKETDFAVPVKVIAPAFELEGDQQDNFFSGVSEATNSQKQIRPQDLKANTRELRALQHVLKPYNIFLKIKQGVNATNKYDLIKIEDMAKLIYSFVNQAPGTARSSVRSLFESHYKTIFLNPNYDQDPNKIEFLRDLVMLYFKVDEIQGNLLREGKAMTQDSAAIFGNGKFAIMALLGVAYRYVNEDAQSWPQVKEKDYIYGSFMQNVTDDFDKKLKFAILKIVHVIQVGYDRRKKSAPGVTITNYLKKDSSYEQLAQEFLTNLASSENDPEMDALYPSCLVLKRDSEVKSF